MATELAKAYVQIIPSTEGIKGKLTEALGGEASLAGDHAGKTAGTSLASKIKKVIAAAGIGTALKAALMEGADLQQSLGGIETLFKDSADKVIANAKNAYMTAGLSANEYMESVTSFSASLLQGLAGDTNKAADVADMALTDMSDNANKMGTSMELIQNAYQGFAKQNYTMLDNLKLGYGGTKTEMQRLLADASKLSGVKYDISNLSDVYEAIHVIQGEMGITGTTALEASETFSGSLATMKASLSNLLGSLTLGEDIQPAMAALIESTGTFLFNNLFPMVGNILTGLAQYIVDTAMNTDWVTVITQILTTVRDVLSTTLQTYFGADTTLINDMFGFLIDGLPTIMETVQTCFGALWEFCSTVWRELGKPIFDVLQECLGSVFSAIEEHLPEIMEFVTQCFADIQTMWESNLKPCLEAIGNFISTVLAPIFKSVFEGTIKPLVTTVFNTIKSLWEGTLKPVFEGITDFLTGVFTLNWEKALGGIVSILTGVINGMITSVEHFINMIITGLNGLFAGINELAAKAGDALGFTIQIPVIPTITLPKISDDVISASTTSVTTRGGGTISMLAKGGVLEKGQIGLLEGSGAEAVVPLENNAKWISEVAKDMNAATGNNDLLEKMLNVLMEMKTTSEETVEAIAQMKLEIDNREFARLVRTVN